MADLTYSYTINGAQAPTASNGGGIDQGTVLWILFILVVVILVVILIWLVQKKRAKLRQQKAFHKKAIQVSLPKQQVSSSDQQAQRDNKELIGVMEPLFSSLHYFHQSKWWDNFWNGQDTFSFEITAKEGEIFFYVVVPDQYVNQIERQIHAQYASANLELVDNYDIFNESNRESAIGTLGLLKSEIFPIRTYKEIESDPLNGISNSLSKIIQGSATIQLLVQPTKQSWQRDTEKALQNIQQGKSFESGNGHFDKFFSVLKEIGQAVFISKSEEHNQNDAQNVTAGNVRLTALQEQQTKLLAEKGGKVGFKVQIRCLARASTQLEAKNIVQTMLSSFSQFHLPESNGFKQAGIDDRKIMPQFILRSFSSRQPKMIMNSEELTSIYHFPNIRLDTPNIHWLSSRRLPPPSNIPKDGIRIGFSNFRGIEIPVNISYADRTRHLYMIGKTGVGKTNMFENMVLQDIRAGNGICYMDPNGDAVEWILRHIPKERAEDVILFDPSDTIRPMALNLLEFDPNFPEQKTMVINEMISIFDKLYDLKATGGPMFEQYMRNAMLLIMDDPDSGSTLMEIPKVLADADFRKYKISKSHNQVVIDFWVKEAEKAGGEAALANMVPYITSKLTQFTSNDIMRPIIGQQKSAFSFREIMDQKKILLVNLPKGLLGEMNAQLLGMIISGKIQIAAFSRQNQLESERVPFYLYVDEFQNFTSKTFATILAESRKYKLSLNITNQYIMQLDEDTRNAVVGNVGTMIVWRVGANDADFLKKEFEPLEIDDMVNVEKYNFYIKELIDGSPSRPFNVTAYPPDSSDNFQMGEAIRQLSRLKFGRDREIVENEIRVRAIT
jgi:hypothetical protein